MAGSLTSVQRHVQASAPSGIIDMSEHSISTQSELDCFGSKVITAAVAHGIVEIHLSKNSIMDVPKSMTQPLSGLQVLNLSHNKLVSVGALSALTLETTG